MRYLTSVVLSVMVQCSGSVEKALGPEGLEMGVCSSEPVKGKKSSSWFVFSASHLCVVDLSSHMHHVHTVNVIVLEVEKYQ